MTDNSVINDLKMAEISLAKVPDINQLASDARAVMDNFRTNINVKEQVENALNTVNQRSDYQLDLGTVQAVDEIINKYSNVVVKDGQPIVSGTEAFGLTLMPSEWRTTRTAALKEILSETYRNIKRWANQLSDNFQTRWVELMTTTEVLESRLESLDATLDLVTGIVDGITDIELNELIARSISKNGRVLTGDVGKALQGEINYIMLCLRAWEMEQVKFKNSVIRYFGNERNKDITDVTRELPKLFDQRYKLADDNQGMLTGKMTRPMLDDHAFEGIALEPSWIKANIKSEADGTTYADALSYTGYHVKPSADKGRVGKTTVPVMPISQMYVVRDVIATIINRLKTMNLEEDPVNFNPDDVKDVLNTLKNSDGTGDGRAYQYGLITADYQYDVNQFKTQVSNMLTVEASHLITMLNQHLGCYNVE